MTRKRILLVDDSESMLAIEKFILQNDPYDLLTAANGEEALRQAIEHVPDLILLDVIMPRMGGIEASRLIRENERTKHIPIIMVTSTHERENARCDDFISKPINSVELLSKVRRFLQRD